MVVSARGTLLGTKVNPAVRIIHLYAQTKWRVQLQAMLSVYKILKLAKIILTSDS